MSKAAKEVTIPRFPESRNKIIITPSIIEKSYAKYGADCVEFDAYKPKVYSGSDGDVSYYQLYLHYDDKSYPLGNNLVRLNDLQFGSILPPIDNQGNKRKYRPNLTFYANQESEMGMKSVEAIKILEECIHAQVNKIPDVDGRVHRPVSEKFGNKCQDQSKKGTMREHPLWTAKFKELNERDKKKNLTGKKLMGTHFRNKNQPMLNDKGQKVFKELLHKKKTITYENMHEVLSNCKGDILFNIQGTMSGQGFSYPFKIAIAVVEPGTRVQVDDIIAEEATPEELSALLNNKGNISDSDVSEEMSAENSDGEYMMNYSDPESEPEPEPEPKSKKSSSKSSSKKSKKSKKKEDDEDDFE